MSLPPGDVSQYKLSVCEVCYPVGCWFVSISRHRVQVPCSHRGRCAELLPFLHPSPSIFSHLSAFISSPSYHLQPSDTPTYSFKDGAGSSVLDLTIAALLVAREVSNWAINKQNLTGSDHEVVTFQITSLHPDADFTSPEPHLNWKKTNWDTFTSTLQNLSTENYPLWSSLRENPT
jgi:hypothetical protein